MKPPGPDRYPPIPEVDWTDAQRSHVEPMLEGPRKAIVSPFVPLMRSPQLMDRVQRVGEYLRYDSVIGRRLTELAILCTARFWDQPVEWAIHAPIARQEGIDPAIIAALAAARTPDFRREDERVVHATVDELLRTRRLSDASHAQALRLFGEQGVIDLFGVIGYYTLLSVVMNGAQTAAPDTTAPPLV
ncbi:MAG: carboxymuconolactone decarboxylase family protein [Paracoccus sp. (in: a-proteobacteria)]|uniref:carboxymuconolactone decarboxylase family protein n=1 Tax=unclassified Paracoccus (in: a-proteobacteria) TaxID=2688777 RepID=UPI000C560B93|nr:MULTISPECIES: carboxymuconolactone decarboxylase family protein [unclassified Paracoccus (in: a-proteobacteria)]MBA49961.1 carboxymuconolactone decarboxylase [Paracoccus sp. (in: a-proteobacteria)]MCS5600950.1 carboxymuconolactone decarboxylase family protein [Paracoccus sp. (in: a-proteobacteria)]MDB2552635.1 carboxymuconolactone decarboxylase family protein [Paracoccus sp. (in: a-proteobacteria)]